MHWDASPAPCKSSSCAGAPSTSSASIGCCDTSVTGVRPIWPRQRLMLGSNPPTSPGKRVIVTSALFEPSLTEKVARREGLAALAAVQPGGVVHCTGLSAGAPPAAGACIGPARSLPGPPPTGGWSGGRPPLATVGWPGGSAPAATAAGRT